MSSVFYHQKNKALAALHSLSSDQQPPPILVNKGITKYFILDSYKTFLDLVRTEFLQNTSPNYFEYIPGNSPVPFFFDIEIYDDSSFFSDYQSIINACVHSVKSLFTDNDSYTFTKILLESHSDVKKSFHLILRVFNELGTQILFPSVTTLKTLYKQLHLDRFKDDNNKNLVDPSVYREGLFRTLYSSKGGEHRPLKRSDLSDDFEDIQSFVCHLDQDELTSLYNVEIVADEGDVCLQHNVLNCNDCDIVNDPEDLTSADVAIIKKFVQKEYHHVLSKIRGCFVDVQHNCIVVALDEKGCHFIDREHKSNNGYIVIDTCSSKQKCHDPDCIDKKHNEIKLINLPYEIQEIIKRCLKVNRSDLGLIENALEECKTYITENFDQNLSNLSFDRTQMVFRGHVSNPAMSTLLRGTCPQCNVEHQISHDGYCMRCTVCDAIYPNKQLIPVDTRFQNLNKFWVSFSNVSNTVINNYYGGEEDFSCDVQLESSLFRDKKLLSTLNECLDGHKITKMAEIMHLIYKNYVFTLNEWYLFDSRKWIVDHQRISFKKDILTLCNLLNKIKQHYENKNSDDNTVKLIKNVKSLINKLNKPQLKEDIIKESQIFYFDNDFYKLFNSKKHLVPFHNGVYDLLLNKFRKTKKDDYVNLTVGFDYDRKVANPEVYDFVNKVLPNENVRHYVLKKMSECLNGDIPNTNFLMFIGDGANGKSQLLNLAKITLGEFAEKVEVTLLTRKRNNANEANTEKIKLMNKRFAFLSEPEDGEKINIGLLKELTGSEEIVARGLYQDSVSFVMEAKLFLACNELPDIKGEDTALWRRIRVIDFPSRFVQSPKESNEYQIDSTLPSRMREDLSWRQTFMNILLDYYFKFVEEPVEVQIKTNEYRDENNEFHAWLDDNIQHNQGDILQLTEVCEVYLGRKVGPRIMTKYKKEIEKYIKVKYKESKYEYQKGVINDMNYRGWVNFSMK